MRILRTPLSASNVLHRASQPVVLVPTMGALHAGHVALIRRARRLATEEGTVVVSIFVNPTQFGPREDFSRYPRTFAADRVICAAEGVDFVFAPTAEQMYLPGHSIRIDEMALSTGLCGASRPGHFSGVCTVVAKLFQICAPQIAVFGRKDYQQLAIIRRLVRDLNFPVRIVGEETVREPDGLALSSRNRYLNPDERSQATVIRQALLEAVERVRAGVDVVATLKSGIRRRLRKASAARLDYLEIVDGETLAPVRQVTRGTVALAAAWFGKTRLIDNITLRK